MRISQSLLAAALSIGGFTCVTAIQSPAGSARAPGVQQPATATAQASQVTTPREESSVRFAIIGDTGTGTRSQFEVAAQLTKARQLFPFEFVIAYFHHPLYSSGEKHGSELDLRAQVEPLFIRYGVDVVFAGHEHFYERIKPQKGIYYFIQGGSAKLRKGDISGGALTAAGFDTDLSFTLAELGKDAMQFQTLSRLGKPVDSGTLRLGEEPQAAIRDPTSISLRGRVRLGGIRVRCRVMPTV